MQPSVDGPEGLTGRKWPAAWDSLDGLEGSEGASYRLMVWRCTVTTAGREGVGMASEFLKTCIILRRKETANLDAKNTKIPPKMVAVSA